MPQVPGSMIPPSLSLVNAALDEQNAICLVNHGISTSSLSDASRCPSPRFLDSVSYRQIIGLT